MMRKRKIQEKNEKKRKIVEQNTNEKDKVDKKSKRRRKRRKRKRRKDGEAVMVVFKAFLFTLKYGNVAKVGIHTCNDTFSLSLSLSLE